MKAFFDPLYRTRYLGTQVLQPFNHSTPSPLTLNSFSALFQYARKVSQHWHHSTFWEHYHLLCICLLLVNKSLRLFGAESDFSRAPHFAVWNDPDLASKSTLLEVWGFFFRQYCWYTILNFPFLLDVFQLRWHGLHGFPKLLMGFYRETLTSFHVNQDVCIPLLVIRVELPQLNMKSPGNTENPLCRKGRREQNSSAIE